MKTRSLITLILIAGVAIEAALLIRVWAQSTSQPMDGTGMTVLFDVTDVLASPFSAITGDLPSKESGVVDYTVLVALEAYFVAMVGVIVLVLVLRGGWSWLDQHRPVHLPDFVLAQMDHGRERRLWQPTYTGRRSGARFYVLHTSFVGRPDKQEHPPSRLRF
jgi:hypothetical protein